MAEQLAGTAVIKIKLSVSPEDRAILAGGAGRIPGGGGGFIPGGGGGGGGGRYIPGMAPGGGGAPGSTSRGGGILSTLKGAGLVAAGLAVAQGTPIGAIATSAVAGSFDRLKSFSTDVMEQTGIGAWARAGTRGQRSTQALIAQLGAAAAPGAGASDEQIKLLYRMTEAMEALKDEGENRIRSVTGEQRIMDLGERLYTELAKLVRFVTGSSTPKAVGGIG